VGDGARSGTALINDDMQAELKQNSVLTGCHVIEGNQSQRSPSQLTGLLSLSRHAFYGNTCRETAGRVTQKELSSL